MTKVTIGGNERVIPPFSAFKAFTAGRIVAAITEHGEGVLAMMSQYAREHEKRNQVVLSRATAHFESPERASRVSEEAWHASGNTLTLPGEPPSLEEQLAAVFPRLLDVAEGHVLRLLALVLADDRDLEQRYRDGGREAVDEFLTEQGTDLLFRADAEDLFTLAQAAWDVCREQLAQSEPARRAVGKLLNLVDRSAKQTATTESSPSSSTGSQTPTAGRAKRSSSARRTASSSSSSKN